MLPAIHYDAYRIGFLKACMNYNTYGLERTIERKEKRLHKRGRENRLYRRYTRPH